MKYVLRHSILFLFFTLLTLTPCLAQDSIPAAESPAPAEEKSEKFDAKSFIFGHTGDA